MSAESYSIQEYRKEIWEGEIIKWPTGKVRTESGERLAEGDTIIFVFVKTGTHEAGIYGWGILTDLKKEKELIFFRPTYPSDYLKMNPIWDDEISSLLDAIRGSVKVGTMWKISTDHAAKIRGKIHTWMK